MHKLRDDVATATILFYWYRVWQKICSKIHFLCQFITDKNGTTIKTMVAFNARDNAIANGIYWLIAVVVAAISAVPVFGGVKITRWIIVATNWIIWIIIPKSIIHKPAIIPWICAVLRDTVIIRQNRKNQSVSDCIGCFRENSFNE